MACKTSTNRHATLLGACLARGVRGGCALSCPVAIGTGFRASAARLQPRAILQVRAGLHFCAPCSRADTQLKLVRVGFWIRARISSFAAYFGPEGMSSAAARIPSGRTVCETAGQSDAASKSLAFAVSLVPQNRKCAPRSSIRIQARLPPRLRPEGASGETLFLTGAVHAAFRGAALFAEPNGRNAPCCANPWMKCSLLQLAKGRMRGKRPMEWTNPALLHEDRGRNPPCYMFRARCGRVSLRSEPLTCGFGNEAWNTLVSSMQQGGFRPPRAFSSTRPFEAGVPSPLSRLPPHVRMRLQDARCPCCDAGVRARVGRRGRAVPRLRGWSRGRSNPAVSSTR